MNIADIAAHWVASHVSLGLGGPVRDEAHYDQLMEVVKALMGDVSALENSSLSGLVDLVADRIREYEHRVRPWPDLSDGTTWPAPVRSARGGSAKRGVCGVVGQARFELAANPSAG